MKLLKYRYMRAGRNVFSNRKVKFLPKPCISNFKSRIHKRKIFFLLLGRAYYSYSTPLNLFTDQSIDQVHRMCRVMNLKQTNIYLQYFGKPDLSRPPPTCFGMSDMVRDGFNLPDMCPYFCLTFCDYRVYGTFTGW
jgi:hypothetical protein